MNRETVIRLAREAGFSRDDVMPNSWMVCPHEAIQRFAAAVEANCVPQWISVEDRLPEEGETCDGRVSALDCDGIAMIGIVSCGSVLTSNGKATHWMPLPSAPALKEES